MSSKRSLTLVLSVLLFATACGGSDPLEGQAIRVAAQASEFCDEAYSDIWGDFATDALQPDNAQEFAESINQVLTTIPDDAPRDLRRAYETYEEIALLSIDLPLVDPADPDVANLDADTQRRYQDIYAAVNELDGFDQDAISSYVASTCPTQYTSRGFLTTGNPDSAPAQDTESAAPQATPEPTPTPIPIVTNELDVTLNVGRYNGTDIELFSAQSTNATPESLLAGDAVIDPNGESWILVHVGLTNTFASRTTFGTGAFRIIGPDNRPIVEDDRLDSRGASGAIRSIEGREFVEGYISFLTNELLGDLTDWTFVVDQNDHVPEAIPLVASYTNQYPIELASGAAGSIHMVPTENCSEPVARWDAEVTEAFVSLNAQREVSGRVPSEKRRVVVRLSATNAGPATGSTWCDSASWHSFNLDLRLDVDGRPTAHVGGFRFGGSSDFTEVGDSNTLEAIFEIDATASSIALVTGADDEIIAEWSLDMPLILDR